MKHTRLAALGLLLLGAACSHSARRVRVDNSPQVTVVVHSDIDQSVAVRSHSMERFEDGRMGVRLLLESSKGRDLSVIVQTNWFNDRGGIVEAGQVRTVVLPSAAPTLVEDASMGPEATACTVSVRPSSTRRRN